VQERAILLMKELFSKVLKMPSERLDADDPFEKYGVDSIVVMQLTNEFETVFGSLSKTLFFEYQTIQEITDYFLQAHADKMRSLLTAQEEKPAAAVPAAQSQPASAQPAQPQPVNTPAPKVQAAPAPSSRGRKRPRPLAEQATAAAGSSSASTAPASQAPAHVSADIAIIGLAGRYAQSPDVNQFWENLKAGKDCITEVPEDRWNHALYYDEDRHKPGKTYGKWGGFLDGIDQFDPLFFNISPREAEIMDPQERLFLECVYEAMQDAGYTREELGAIPGRDLPGSVGVYVGVMYEEYQLYGAQAQLMGNHIIANGSPSSIANRVSYFCNFHGPSIAIDTMCSSSLTAIHLACQSIRSGECSLAIAGGVNVTVHPNKYLALAHGNFLSSKGRCESFGEEGDGYVPGEGVGAVLLKPLAQAVADGDHIYGVIKGTAINHGGKSNWYTVPNPVAQASVIGRALKEAGVNPRAISYLEAHGTGTSLGDPIEITGLTKSFSEYTTDRQFCSIGSGKSNIGHCESASGIAALTKVLLQMKHQQLVPSLHSKTLNPNIDFSQTPFYVQQELAEWKRPVLELDGELQEFPRIAGVSAFGAGGTNAHVIVEEYIPETEADASASQAPAQPVMIVLSAKNKDALQKQARRLLLSLEKAGYRDADLLNIAYTLQLGREAMEERLGFYARSIQEVEDKLRAFLEGRADSASLYLGRLKRNHEPASPETKEYSNTLEAWVDGQPVVWKQQYAGLSPQRISLPTYPFAKQRYWVPKPPQLTAPTDSPAQTDTAVYVKDWEEKALAGRLELPAGLLVVLASPATQALASCLYQDRRDVQKVIVIHNGDQHTAEAWTADFYSESSGESLYRAVKEKQRDQKLLGVIDITAYDAGYEQSKRLEAGKIRFLQLLLERDRNEGFKLLQVTHRLQGHLLPQTTMQGARTAGLYRMISAEYKQVVSVTMDSEVPVYEAALLSQQIEAEYGNSAPGVSTECLYRNGLRYESKLVLALSKPEIAANAHRTPDYLADDVILITGGSRGIGASIAEHIVSQGVRNLVILGREALPPRSEWKSIVSGQDKPALQAKLQRMQALIDRGVNVYYSHTALTDAAGLQALLQTVHQELGAITGVYHCAGSASANPAFLNKPISDIATVCEPKIAGMATLYEALAQEPLKFFTLFSSVSGISPKLGAGQSDYAMANSYMDSFAQHKQGEGKIRVISVQWPAWGETGMASNGLPPAFQKTGLVSLSTQEGLTLLDGVQQAGYAVCMPCVVRPELFSAAHFLQTEPPAKTERPAAKPAEAAVKPVAAPATASNEGAKQEIRGWLQQLFISELKLTMEQLDDDTPFDEYGVDSVLLAQLAHKMSSRLGGVVLDPSLLLEYSTITALIQYFITNHANSFEQAVQAVQELQAVQSVQEVHAATIQPAATQYTSTQPAVSQPVYASAPVTEPTPVPSSIPTPAPQYSAPQHGASVEDAIAVVGIACRFPGAPTKEAYWELLTRGTSAIKSVPQSRWTPQAGRQDFAGWVDDIERFDPKFFLINEQDAAIMDPQARVILEESLKAIYDAGYAHKDLFGEKVGVYIGGRSQTRTDIQTVLEAPNPILGIGQNYLATNISRFFNFRGPSLVLDTACSSAITSMQFAIDSLRGGRINMALVGAVNLILSPYTHEIFAARNLLSKDGVMRIFDKNADGEVLGEGAGVVILKRLQDAVRDGNQIYGVVKGVAVNNDGRTLGPGSPNLTAQKQVMQEALEMSGLHPTEVGYIEVNGGGSPVTDSLEIKALSEVYDLKNQALQPVVLGSVKPNIGHLLLTSGMAGFIRCLLSVHHKQIPLFRSAQEPFEHYDFASSRIQFNRETLEWKALPGKKRIAALNTFPDGGTNCHALIEEYVPDATYRRAAFSQPLPNLDRRSFPLNIAPLNPVPQPQGVSSQSASISTMWGNYDEKVL
jgi:acyl transferase domain-containing protein/acyl carrier protein